MRGKGGGGDNPVTAMGKALIARATPGRTGTGAGRAGEPGTMQDIFLSKDGAFVPSKHRAFLMDTQVKYTIVSISLNSGLIS